MFDILEEQQGGQLMKSLSDNIKKVSEESGLGKWG